MSDFLNSSHSLINSVISSTIHSLHPCSDGKTHCVTTNHLPRLTALGQILLSDLPIVDVVLCDRGHLPVRHLTKKDISSVISFLHSKTA